MNAVSNARDARLEAIPWLGRENLARARRGRIAVVGQGNIGSQLAQHMALSGIGMLLIDRDIVSEHNLGTTPLTWAVGLPKAEALRNRLAPLNPFCRIEALHADISRVGMGVLRDVSLIASCVDSVESRVAINRLAVRLGLPWVDAAIDGSGRTLFGRVAAYAPASAQSACFLCPHNAASLAVARAGDEPGKGCRLDWRGPQNATPPTLAVSALGGTAASIQAMWALKCLAGLGGEIAGSEVYFDLDRGVMSKHALRANGRCVIDHCAYTLVPAGRGSIGFTVGRTFGVAEGMLPGEGEVSLCLEARSLVLRLRCPACGATREMARLVECVSDAEAACSCGREMQPGAQHMVDRFDRALAAGFLDATWAEIGLPDGDVVLAARGERRVALLLGGEEG